MKMAVAEVGGGLQVAAGEDSRRNVGPHSALHRHHDGRSRLARGATTDRIGHHENGLVTGNRSVHVFGGSGFEDAVAGEEETAAQKTSPVVHACWMGVADFIAAMTPVVPFIFLPLAQAKIVFIFTTALLLLLLGIGRAKLGERPMFRTIIETCAIAATAAIAGALVGLLISS